MSTAKVIFTYKRKRLSSRCDVGTSDVCPDFSADSHAGKPQAVPEERSEKDPMIFKVGLNDADCSMDYQSCLDPSNQHVESKLQVQGSGACNSRERHNGSNELSEDNSCKASGENGCTETIVDTTKSSCSDLESSRAFSDGCLEVSKRKLTAPLLTFSRRLKRKDTGNSAILGEIPAKEGGVGIRESEPICAPATSCKEMINKIQAVEKSATLKVTTDNIVTGNMLCQSREKMTNKESGDSSCLCTKSSPDIPALRQIEEKRCSQDDLVVNVPFFTKQSSSVSSALDAPKTTNIQKEIALRSSDDEILSCCDDVCKTVEQHVSNQCRTSSGDSQLTSSDCSDVKTFADKPMQNTASSASLDVSNPPSGAFVIDCNLIPESNLQEKESDAVHHSSDETENHGKVMEKGQLKRKDLELFRDIDLKVVDSPSSDVVRLSNDLYTPMAAGKKPETKYLQLFSEAGQNGHLASATTTSEMGSRGAQSNGTYYSNCDMPQLKQASRKASATIGLSLPMEPMHKCQTSRHSSGMRKDHNVSIREFIQNPAVQSFPDQSSLMWQQKVLLDTCNSRATALRGNRAMSLDRFEPGGPMWSEEELDSLWIGIRRHGRGNWHAMLLDPKLRFAPWRVARDLAAQWDREQCNLFNRQHMSIETRLSLGDVYARREGGCFRGNVVNESRMNVTLAGKLGNYSGNSFSIRDGMGFDPNKYLPHWLQEPAGTCSKFFEPSPGVSAIPQVGGVKLVGPFSEPSATSCWGRNLDNFKVPGTMPGEIQAPSGGEPSKRKQSREKNLIVIDSDGSSEETISDDHNIKN
ncbi:uncharacterized protein LOC141647859 [Silene latifolia]|uniref:uncharacterized protein LOC141647859 n=1 Tax=Silene latifolia TaxID=37657 RepID=UPI003D7717B1